MESNGFALIKNIIEEYLPAWNNIMILFKLIIIKIIIYNNDVLQ